jgi:hypothetical protein
MSRKSYCQGTESTTHLIFGKQILNVTPTLVSTSVHSDSVPSGWAGTIVADLRFRLLQKGKHNARKNRRNVRSRDSSTPPMRTVIHFTRTRSPYRDSTHPFGNSCFKVSISVN